MTWQNLDHRSKLGKPGSAWLSWDDAATRYPQLNLDVLIKSDVRKRKLLKDRTRLSDGATRMLASLNDFDREKVVGELVLVAENPKDPAVQTPGWAQRLVGQWVGPVAQVCKQGNWR